MRPDSPKVWTETVSTLDLRLVPDGGELEGPRQNNVAPMNRAVKSTCTVIVQTWFNAYVVTKIILQNTISSQNCFELIVLKVDCVLKEKPVEHCCQEQSRAYSELSFELVLKLFFKWLYANYQFRTVLFSVESFDSWLCCWTGSKIIRWTVQQGIS